LIHLYCATGNPGKLREFRMAAAGELEIEPLPNFGNIPASPEDGQTFEENAIRKARYYGKHASRLLFADDSGLVVEALNGAPGVLSARFAGQMATDAANNKLLLENLEGVTNRTARFFCAIALVEGERLVQVFQGVVAGSITGEPRGNQGFGYDPLFYFSPFGCTFGEVSAERKFAVSHRGHALRAMREWLLRGLQH
jgi:XTP/dITP diphosphohydrolase